jgi:hypothetical protein
MPQGRHTGRRSSAEQRRLAQRRRHWAIGAIAAGLVVVTVVLLLARDDDDTDAVAGGAVNWDATPFAGGARLAVDQLEVDHGEVPYNHTVDATFRLKNVGDQPLELEQPEVEILDGC